MLYSSKYKFVFSKSIKTASTSVEAALEFLIRGELAPHWTDSVLFPDGSRIGLRGREFKQDPNFGTSAFSYNHQSLEETKDAIGVEAFESAVKISSIRNPYDRFVSAFHYFTDPDIPKFSNLKNTGRVDEIKTLFKFYLQTHPTARYDARDHFYCKSRLAIDQFIRREFIGEDLSATLDTLNVTSGLKDVILSNIPSFKTSGRGQSLLTVSDYYDEETLSIINQRVPDWFDFGGYKMVETISEMARVNI